MSKPSKRKGCSLASLAVGVALILILAVISLQLVYVFHHGVIDGAAPRMTRSIHAPSLAGSRPVYSSWIAALTSGGLDDPARSNSVTASTLAPTNAPTPSAVDQTARAAITRLEGIVTKLTAAVEDYRGRESLLERKVDRMTVRVDALSKPAARARDIVNEQVKPTSLGATNSESARTPSIDEVQKSLTQCGVNGLFKHENVSDVLPRICSRRPFSWIRWGDGEIDAAPGGSDFAAAVKTAFQTAIKIGTVEINVGTWWLCNNRHKNFWNQLVSPSEKFRFTNYFYLPMGDPVSADHDEGWVQLAQKCSRKVVAVVPQHLERLPVWPRDVVFIRSPMGQSLPPVDQTIRHVASILAKSPERVLVVVAAGISAKILIVNLTVAFPDHQYIDVRRSPSPTVC